MKKKLFSMVLALLATLGGSTVVCQAQQRGQTIAVENPAYASPSIASEKWASASSKAITWTSCSA